MYIIYWLRCPVGDLCCVSFRVSLSLFLLSILNCPLSNKSKNVPKILKTVLHLVRKGKSRLYPYFCLSVVLLHVKIKLFTHQYVINYTNYHRSHLQRTTHSFVPSRSIVTNTLYACVKGKKFQICVSSLFWWTSAEVTCVSSVSLQASICVCVCVFWCAECPC